MIKVYIGPNGYGKTYRLDKIKENLLNGGTSESEIVFLESEILLNEEIRDTKDSTMTMEFIINEILANDDIKNAQIQYEKLIDEAIEINQTKVNNIVDEVLMINETIREHPFISKTETKEYKKRVSINNKDYKNMGSGQKMHFLLRLLKESSRKYIFIDEPEQYSHPSLLNITAMIINELSDLGKEVYLATHSPKLLSMLNLNLRNIHLLNDKSHTIKTIDFEEVTNNLSKLLPTMSLGKKEKSYYDSPSSLMSNINNHYSREFYESLLTKKVFICEGIFDELFIKKVIKIKGESHTDYVIFKTYGKFLIPVFAEIYKSLGIETVIYFDKDNEESPHDKFNALILSYNSIMFDAGKKMNNRIEEALGFVSSGNKGDVISFLAFLETLKIPGNYLY